MQEEKEQKKQEKMKYLVKETTYFVDPHGTPDEAGSSYHITSSLEGYTPIGKYEQYDIIVDEFELRGSEDGYNSTATGCQYVEITEKEEKKYKKILKKYTKMERMFS